MKKRWTSLLIASWTPNQRFSTEALPDAILNQEYSASIVAHMENGFDDEYEYEFNDQIIKDDEKHQESEDISHLLCFLNLFPFHNNPFYITCGAGIGEHMKESRYYYEDYDDKGRAGFLGCGYEFQINQHGGLAPEFRYYKGHLSDEDYSIAEIRLSIHVYFN